MVKLIFTIVIAMVFAGCVGTETPIGKGVISKPHNNPTKTVQK